MITYKIDTGAQTNILPYQQFLRLTKHPKLNKTKVTLTAYNDSATPVKGFSILNVKYKDKTVPILFIIADINSQPIIGLKSSTNLDLIRRIDNIKQVNKFRVPPYLREFGDCFGSLGCFSKVHHIHTDPDIKPSVNPPRRVPIALESKLYDELRRMIKLKVITPVEEPTDWVSSYVAVEKPDLYDSVWIQGN